MTDNCKLKWQPTKEQLDNMILLSYTQMSKQSVVYISKFEITP